MIESGSAAERRVFTPFCNRLDRPAGPLEIEMELKMENKEIRYSAETGIYKISEESSPASSDQVIEEIAQRLLSDIDGCPLFSPIWRTCVFDQLLEMLDDYVLVDLSVVKAHEQCLQTSWNKKAVQRALAKCGDHPQCISEGV